MEHPTRLGGDYNYDPMPGWKLRRDERENNLKTEVQDQKKETWRRIKCDKVIVVDGEEFPVNSTVLATQSTFFANMFPGGMEESKETKVTLNHPQINLSGFRDWLEEINSPGSVKLTSENVLDVMKVANYTQSQWVLRRCNSTIQELLSLYPGPSRKQFGINVYSLAYLFDNTSLQFQTRNFVIENLAEALHNNEFQSAICAPMLLEILKEKDLTVTSEEKLFLGIMNWVNFDISAREPMLGDILKLVDLHVVSAAILKDSLYKDEFMKNKQCLDLYIDAMHCHAIEEIKANRSRRPRHQRYSEEEKFLVTFKCELPMYYEHEEDKWHPLPGLIVPPGRITKCTSTLSTIYALVNSTELWKYSCTGNEWEKLSSPPNNFDDLVYLNGTLYLMQNRRMWRSVDGIWNECKWCDHNCIMSFALGKYIIRVGRSNSKKTYYCSCYDVKQLVYVRIEYLMTKPTIAQKGGIQSVLMIDGCGIYDWHKWIKYCIKNGENMDTESGAAFLISQDRIPLQYKDRAILLKDKLHFIVGQTLFLHNTDNINSSNICRNITNIKEEVSILTGEKSTAFVSLPRVCFCPEPDPDYCWV